MTGVSIACAQTLGFRFCFGNWAWKSECKLSHRNLLPHTHPIKHRARTGTGAVSIGHCRRSSLPHDVVHPPLEHRGRPEVCAPFQEINATTHAWPTYAGTGWARNRSEQAEHRASVRWVGAGA